MCLVCLNLYCVLVIIRFGYENLIGGLRIESDLIMLKNKFGGGIEFDKIVNLD